VKVSKAHEHGLAGNMLYQGLLLLYYPIALPVYSMYLRKMYGYQSSTSDSARYGV